MARKAKRYKHTRSCTKGNNVQKSGSAPYLWRAKEVQVPTKLTTMTVRGMGAAIKGGNYHGCS